MARTPTLVARSGTRPHRARAARLAPGERRAHLLACALRVFAARGLGAARPADVAADAGVALPTVFHYFPTREALLDAVLDAVEHTLGDVVEQIAGEPAPDRLARIVRAFADTVDEHPAMARVWLDWSTAAGGSLWPRYLAFYDRMHAVITAAVRRGQQTGELRPELAAADAARLFIGSAHVIVQMKLRGRSRDEVDRLVEAVSRLFAGAAATPS